MSTFLIVLGWIIAYLTVGAFYARSQVIDTYKRSKAEWGIDSIAHSDVTMVTTFRLLFWPAFVPFDMFRGPVASWMRAPLDTRKDQAARLRKDASAWRDKRYTGTPEERAMADELARMCEERAREVDL